MQQGNESYSRTSSELGEPPLEEQKRSLIGHTVRRWRLQDGLTQAELANSIDDSLATVTSVEQGRRGIRSKWALFVALAGGPQDPARLQEVAQAGTADGAIEDLIASVELGARQLTKPLDKGTSDFLLRALMADDVLEEHEKATALERLYELARREGVDDNATSLRNQANYYLVRTGWAQSQHVVEDLHQGEGDDLVQRGIEIGTALAGDDSLLRRHTIDRLLDNDRAAATDLAYSAYWYNERTARSPKAAYRDVTGDWLGDRTLRGLLQDLKQASPITPTVLITLTTLLRYKDADLFERHPDALIEIRRAIARLEATEPDLRRLKVEVTQRFGRLVA